MSKPHFTSLLAASVAGAIQSHPNEALANTVTYTVPATFSISTSGSFTVPISPEILDANELISISDGTATGGEGGTFNLLADYTGGAQQLLYTTSVAPPTHFSVSFANIPTESFPAGSINGLTFQVSGLVGASEIIPAGTVFTFNAVPEPTTMAMFGMGAAGLWLATRRRV